MGEPYVGEIRMFAGNFPPNGWAFCSGQLLPISENETLFNLIGTTYGGDGQETFALPNLQSRVPIPAGTGPDGTTYQLGESGGTESVTLTVQQIPAHTHPMTASSDPANTPNPGNNVLARSGQVNMFFNGGVSTQMNAQSVGPAGGSQPHENCQPFLVINFILSLFGVFPSQN
jgi:microcystin-dependent protein